MKIIYFFLIFFLLSSIYASDFVIQGKVRHVNTHEEISDVNIYVKNLAIGTTSDDNGRFRLIIPVSKKDLIIVFDHIAYDTMQISLENAIEQSNFYLKPNLLQTNKIIVEAKKARSEFAKDLPQSLTIITAREFEGKGYIDVGDLLRVDQSIVIDEDLSGKKTISMRGGNAEDVVVFYNGVKMNNNYDNVFDLSLINIEDIEQIEVIKGSNTALFGSDAFSGVINIIPKSKQNYTARFIQKFGSYNSGDWNFQVNHDILKNLFVSYNQKRSGSKRPYDIEDGYLENSSIHHSANMVYNLDPGTKGWDTKNISVMYMRSKLDYFNSNIFSRIDDLNQLGSISYVGNIGDYSFLKMVASYQNLDNQRVFTYNFQNFDRHFFNDNIFLNLENSFVLEKFSLLMAYQFEDGKLDFNEESETRVGYKSALFKREKQGAVGIFKLDTPTGSDFLETAEISVSYRFDHITNTKSDAVQWNEFKEQELIPGLIGKNIWQANTAKFSTQLKGSTSDISYGIFLSTGNNVKFPTMFHQLSTPLQFNPNRPEISASLSPERNKSTEIGVEVIRETPAITMIDGWQVNLNYFSNLYENKFRSTYAIGFAQAFYDNVPNASLDGIEASAKVFFWSNKLNVELGASRYFISEKAAFPFKSEIKYIAKIMLDWEGYSAKLNWFSEGEQVGWLQLPSGDFGAIPFDGFSNIDIHLGKKFDLDYVELNFTFSGRNLLSDDTILEGIAIHDRRFYVGMGIEY